MTDRLSESVTAERPLKILSIDGGGFKGLYTAALLRELEKAHGWITDHFDMLCGTSTGALIVLPLSIGKSASDIVEFYKQWGPRIFPQQGRLGGLRRWIRFAWRKSKYGNARLKQAAESILGTHRMDDANTLLCVPSFNVTTSKPRVFKTDHDHALNRDAKILMFEVAMATAAAPLFFPIAACREDNEPVYYIDGGIWANNPAMVGLTEACRFFVGPGKLYDSVEILSFANVNPPAGRLASSQYPNSLLGFATLLVEVAMEGQQCSTDLFLQFLSSTFSFPVTYVRVAAPKLSSKQIKGINLDIATQQAIDTLIDQGRDMGHACKNRADVKAFFSQPALKLYRRTQ